MNVLRLFLSEELLLELFKLPKDSRIEDAEFDFDNRQVLIVVSNKNNILSDEHCFDFIMNMNKVSE